MARFANGYNLPTAIIVGMLAEEPSVDREEVLRIAACLALRDSGADEKQLATNFFRPDLSLIDGLKMPDFVSPEQVWRWRNLGFKALAEATTRFLEDAAARAVLVSQLPAVARAAEVFNTTLWVELLKSKLKREQKLAEQVIKKGLQEE